MRLLTAILLVLVCVSPVYAQGVVGASHVTPRTELVGTGLVGGNTVMSDLVSVPADDGGKWQILLFCGPNCAPCEQLKQAFATNPNLKALASTDGTGWAHLNIYDYSNASQHFRFSDYQIKTYPTIIITPSPTAKEFPYYAVYRSEGFDGDADACGRKMVSAITRFADRFRRNPKIVPKVDPEPKPEPETPPLPPTPTPQPTPQPKPDFTPPPNFPPAPNTPSPIQPTDQMTFLVVAADPTGIKQKIEWRFVQAKVNEVKKQYGLDLTLKKLSDAKNYGLTEAELPVVLIMDGQKVVAKVALGSLKDLLDGNKPVPDANPQPTPKPTPKVDPTPNQDTPDLLPILTPLLAPFPWGGWVILGLTVLSIIRKRMKARQQAQQPQPVPQPEPQPVQPAQMVQALDPQPMTPAPYDWTGRPSNRASAAVTQAQSAHQAAQQARSVAVSELQAAEQLLNEEKKALDAVKQGLQG